MNQVLEGFLKGIEIGEGQTHESLTVFPVFVKPVSPTPDYLLLTDALRGKGFEVKEVDREGSVPNLKVVNRLDRSVLILDGEELVGSKQNRIVNTTILVASDCELEIPVTCVEQGRWGYNSPTFFSEERLMCSFLRAEKAQQVQESLRVTHRFMADQGSVWGAINARLTNSGARSATGAMADLYKNRSGRVKEAVEHFGRGEGQCGVLVAVGGRIVGLDVFDSSATYAKLHRRLLESYAIDALDTKKGYNSGAALKKQAEEFLGKIAASKSEDRPGVGLGTDTRIAGEGISGFALSLGDGPLHMAVFHLTESDTEQPGPKLATFLQRMHGRRR